MAIAFFAIFLLYVVLVEQLRVGWLKTIAGRPEQHNEYDFISVIVPVRNEERSICYLLDDLFQQHYPRDWYEVLLVNDHSEDKTLEAAEREIVRSGFPHITIVQAAARGKKSAITEGVKHARGPILATIDGDCRVGPDWLLSINRFFQDKHVMMLTGPVVMNSQKNLFATMQAIEFAGLIASGAATLAHGYPTLCNGANLAYRKTAFEQVGGYEGNSAVASGDDEFLLRKVAGKFPGSVAFNTDQSSIVQTLPQETLNLFFSQRIRWAGKWKAHHDSKSKLLALFIFVFHLLVIGLPLAFLAGWITGVFAIAMLFCKLIFEYRFLIAATSWLGIRWNWFAFGLLQLVYSLYAVTIGIASNFVVPEWKGRRVQVRARQTL